MISGIVKSRTVGVFALLVLPFAFADAAMAKNPILKCDLRRDGSFQGTPTELIVSYEQGAAEMVVYDNMMKFYEIDPRLGKVGRDTNKTLILKWKLSNVRFDNGSRRDILFSFNWDKTTGRAKIRGQPGGVPNHFYGSGKCAFEK